MTIRPAALRFSRHIRRATWLLGLAALMFGALAPVAGAQEEAATPTAAEKADEPAPPPPPEKSSGLKGIRKGTQRITLFGGFRLGQTAASEDIIPRVVNNEVVNMRVEMDDSAFGGLSYSYQWHEKWAVEFGYSQTSTSLVSRTVFDPVETARVIANSTLPVVEQQPLYDRLAGHAGPYDMSLGIFDVGLTRAFSPKSRWVVEAGGGIGWSWSSLKDQPVIFEQLVHSRVNPGTADLYVIANTPIDPTNGADCPTDTDPCMRLEETSGFAFYANGGVSYAFTDHVHLRLGLTVRDIQHAVDPGKSLILVDSQLGLSFLWGGD